MTAVKPIAARLAWLLFFGALGCNESIPVFSSLVASEEPTIRGELVTPEGPPSGLVRAAVLWHHAGTVDSAAETAVQSALVEAAFPAAFSMTIGSPPLDAILAGSVVEEFAEKPRIAYGLIFALRDDGTLAHPFRRLVGGCVDHVVVYAEADMAPGTELERLMHRRLAKGFHLMRVIRDEPDCYELPESLQRCFDFRLEPEPGGFATSVSVWLTSQAVLGVPFL